LTEAIRPASEERASIQGAMGALANRIDYSLFVVTTVSPAGELSGCLAGFVTQCSIEPPRFLVCISKVNHTYFIAERATSIGLHLLGGDQTDLASLFGERTGDRVAKFDCCSWRPGITGVPVLEDCAAWAEGLILDRLDVGDHQAILMRPLTGGDGPCPGVMTYQSAPSFTPGHPATG
jgi:flavin reductase (DIM6/NTAB) family NADH-FMN oxidoreductase RutF